MVRELITSRPLENYCARPCGVEIARKMLMYNSYTALLRAISPSLAVARYISSGLSIRLFAALRAGCRCLVAKSVLVCIEHSGAWNGCAKVQAFGHLWFVA